AAQFQAARNSADAQIALHPGAQFNIARLKTSSISLPERSDLMSFRIQPPAPSRPNRCQLFGPGSNKVLFEKMAKSAADVINLDLEDSVAPSDKETARSNIIDALGRVDWGDKYMSVRINGLDTPWWYRDIVDLL